MEQKLEINHKLYRRVGWGGELEEWEVISTSPKRAIIEFLTKTKTVPRKSLDGVFTSIDKGTKSSFFHQDMIFQGDRIIDIYKKRQLILEFRGFHLEILPMESLVRIMTFIESEQKKGYF